MIKIIQKFIIFTLIVFSFFISSKLVFAATASSDGCYCCGGSQSCTYIWKNKGEALGGNCTVTPAANKTKTTCNGIAGSSTSSAGACWYCEPVSQSKYYKWTTDGSNPNPNYCYAVSGRSQSACSGVPTTTPSSSGSSSGSSSSTDDGYEDEETTGPKVSFNTSDASCNGILGNGEFRNILSDFLNIIRILGVALVIVFSTLDFGKALIAQDNDALKKSSQTAFKRLIIAIVIFFVPAILNILLSLVGISGICI